MNVDQMDVIEKTSVDSAHKSNTDSTLMEFKNSIEAPLCPITPCLTKENVKSTLILKVNEDDDHNPSTPIEDVLGPCASDPHKLMLDPNQTSHLVTSVARKLEFSSNDCVSKNEIENGSFSLMETVYESVLEGIIRKQAEDILAEILDIGSSHEAGDVLMTPPSAARLTGLAETCPGAPLKPKQARKLRTVDVSLCRKLDFDSYG